MVCFLACDTVHTLCTIISATNTVVGYNMYTGPTMCQRIYLTLSTVLYFTHKIMRGYIVLRDAPDRLMHLEEGKAVAAQRGFYGWTRVWMRLVFMHSPFGNRCSHLHHPHHKQTQSIRPVGSSLNTQTNGNRRRHLHQRYIHSVRLAQLR